MAALATTAPTTAQRIANLAVERMHPLPAPDYTGSACKQSRIFCGLESFARHMTNEGHQLQQGLALAGYELWGRHFDNDEADVAKIIDAADPAVVIMQDKREWDDSPENGCCLDRGVAFRNTEVLQCDSSIFRLTVCKDAHSDPVYHRQASMEIGAHAWIAYYHPDIVHHLAPWTRRKHIIRTWHSLDLRQIPGFCPPAERKRAQVSGAASDLYPLRRRVIEHAAELGCDVLRHPGYHSRGSNTGRYLDFINRYKVSICTASIFGYSLRKLIESTATGSVVITDLPPDDPLPQIDGNLIRVSPDISMRDLREIIDSAENDYCEERQRHFAARAQAFYDFRRRGAELAAAIEQMRRGYEK